MAGSGEKRSIRLNLLLRYALKGWTEDQLRNKIRLMGVKPNTENSYMEELRKELQKLVRKQNNA